MKKSGVADETPTLTRIEVVAFQAISELIKEERTRHAAVLQALDGRFGEIAGLVAERLGMTAKEMGERYNLSLDTWAILPRDPPDPSEPVVDQAEKA